jgi:hypothetical protein
MGAQLESEVMLSLELDIVVRYENNDVGFRKFLNEFENHGSVLLIETSTYLVKNQNVAFRKQHPRDTQPPALPTGQRAPCFGTLCLQPTNISHEISSAHRFERSPDSRIVQILLSRC